MLFRSVSQLYRRLETGHQTLVAVGAGVGDGIERAGMLDHAADVVQRKVTESGIAVASEQILAIPQIDWCTCMPEPLSPTMGLGMKVAVLP